MLDGMIVSGYQVEALAPPRNCARPGTAALDMYPMIDEYDDDDLAPAPGMRMKDRSGARFFSIECKAKCRPQALRVDEDARHTGRI